MAESKAKQRRATYQDVLDTAEHELAQIVNGVLYVLPRPAQPHTMVASLLGMELGTPFGRGRGGPGGWIILDEPELHFDEDIVIPDLAGWRRERMPHMEDVAYFTLAPDWIGEVLSPTTARIDRLMKMPLYAAAGVKHAWLVDPRERTLEVFRLHEGRWLATASYLDDARVRAEPFDAIELDLSILWADLPPPTHAAEPVALYETAAL